MGTNNLMSKLIQSINKFNNMVENLLVTTEKLVA